MADNIIMPQLGESIAEGTIVKWLKQPGESVKKDENVVLISTDKVEAEIPSPSAGFLVSIDVGPGETVAVGTVLGKVAQTLEAIEAKPAPKKESAPMPAQTAQSEAKSSALKESYAEMPEKSSAVPEENGDMRGFLSPLVRRIAQEHNIKEQELSIIAGSGRGGRISKQDMLDYVATRASNTHKPTESKPASAPAHNPLQKEIASSGRSVDKPISTMRRVIMENMMASRRTSAHVTTFFEIDYTAIDKIRSAHKDRFKEEEQISLTYTTFLAAAVCQVLKRHPYLNAVINKESITFKKDIHLGMAVAIDQPEPGLMVPVIKDADKQNLRGLAHTIMDLSSRVRSRKIKPDELTGGTFTITNPGNYGALIGTPIINQPQVAILGVGNIKKQAVVLEVDGTDTIAIRRMGLLSLSFDHRLIDGATADIFMADLKTTLETWTQAP